MRGILALPDPALAPRRPAASWLPPPAPPADPAAAAALLAAALRHAARDGRGRVVLRVEDVAPHRRRVARALLQEGALVAGGRVLDGPGGDLLLVGAEAGRAERLRALLERLVGPGATQLLWLERDATALAAYATGGPAPPPRPATAPPDLAGLDEALAALPLAGLVRRRQGWPVAPPAGPPAGPPRPAFLRLEPDRARLAAALGPLGEDADILDHAARHLAARLFAALADPAEARRLLGPAAAPRLHLPRHALARPGLAPRGPDRLPPGLLVATVPLAAAAEPEALAAQAAALAEAGIGLEVEGLDAAALEAIDAAALPGMLRLDWSPALDRPWAAAAVARLGPGRVVLAGATGAEAARLGAAFHEVAA